MYVLMYSNYGYHFHNKLILLSFRGNIRPIAVSLIHNITFTK